MTLLSQCICQKTLSADGYSHNFTLYWLISRRRFKEVPSQFTTTGFALALAVRGKTILYQKPALTESVRLYNLSLIGTVIASPGFSNLYLRLRRVAGVTIHFLLSFDSFSRHRNKTELPVFNTALCSTINFRSMHCLLIFY